jgi:hypothetical protein
MKSSENYPATPIGTLYQFYRSIVFLSAPIKEELAKSYFDNHNPQQSLSNKIFDDLKAIDDSIFDLLEELGSIDILQDEITQNDYSNRFQPIELRN